jgi:hypothetical protein
MIARVTKTRWSARAVVCASLLIAIGVVRAADLAASDWPTKGWSVAAPEAEGLDSGALADVVDWAKSEKVDSLLVVRHGRIVLDSYTPRSGRVSVTISIPRRKVSSGR